MNMKRFIVILACLVLGLSVFAVASAQDATVVEEGGHTTHTWEWVWYGLPKGKTKGPDCVINTVRRLECTGCDAWYTVEVVPATGHKYVEDKGRYKAPTCTAAGEKVEYCDNCNDRKVTPIPQLKHTLQYEDKEGKYVDNKSNARIFGDCTAGTAEGYYITKCKVCGAQDTENAGVPGDHTWKDDEKIDPTCTKEGFIGQKCDVCGAIGPHKVIPALGHLSVGAVDKPAEPATCTAPGHKAGKICAREGCNEYAEGGEEIPALGHKWKDVPAAPATCVNREVADNELFNVGAYKVCERCEKITDPVGAPESVKTPLTAAEAFALHDFVPLNKGEDGKVKDYVCTRCGYIAPKEKVEPQPGPEVCKHEWKEGEIVKAPTCTKAGTVKAECIKCGKTQEIEKKATGHTLVTIKQEGAKKLVACYVCDYSAWIGHEHLWCNVKETVPATCVSGATYLQGCYYCDATRYNKGGIKNPDGHAWCQAVDPKTGVQVTCCYYCDARK